MKFYKCHSAKYKSDKVFFVGEQFTEIGPDAFLQTEFEVIILSNRVTIIKDHAFSDVSNCSIYIPSSAEEIDPSAFDGMGIGNIVYCEVNSLVHKMCDEQGIYFSNNVSECIEKAKRIKDEEETAKRLAAIREMEIKEVERIRREAQEEAERIKKAAQEEAERIKKAAQEEAKIKEEQIAMPTLEVETESVNKNTPQPIKPVTPKNDAPIFVDEERGNKPQMAQPSPNNIQRRTLRYDGPIFVDEEHQQRKTGMGNKKNASVFRNIDMYDEELKKMNPQVNGPAMPMQPPVQRPVEQRVLPKKRITYNLDDYDDELKEMNKQKEKKSVWNIFGDV